jgi:hypothetical protein
MRSLLAATLVLALTAGVANAQGTAGVDTERGKFVHFDSTSRVIVLQDGTMYRVGPNTVVLVDNQPIAYDAYGTIRPGSTVVVRSGERVAYRGGEYITMNPSGAPQPPPGVSSSQVPPTVTAAPVPPTITSPAPVGSAPSGPTVVTQAPPPVVVAPPAPPVVTAPAPPVVTAPGAAVAAAPTTRQTYYGRVTDIDRNEIRVRTDGGESIDLPLPGANRMAIRKGDTVQFDVTVSPGAPAALPRAR